MKEPKKRPQAGTVDWAIAVEAGAEAHRVLSYQRGYNDRMSGREKKLAEYDELSYMAGWKDGERHIKVIS